MGLSLYQTRKKKQKGRRSAPNQEKQGIREPSAQKSAYYFVGLKDKLTIRSYKEGLDDQEKGEHDVLPKAWTLPNRQKRKAIRDLDTFSREAEGGLGEKQERCSDEEKKRS